MPGGGSTIDLGLGPLLLGGLVVAAPSGAADRGLCGAVPCSRVLGGPLRAEAPRARDHRVEQPQPPLLHRKLQADRLLHVARDGVVAVHQFGKGCGHLLLEGREERRTLLFGHPFLSGPVARRPRGELLGNPLAEGQVCTLGVCQPLAAKASLAAALGTGDAASGLRVEVAENRGLHDGGRGCRPSTGPCRALGQLEGRLDRRPELCLRLLWEALPGLLLVELLVGLHELAHRRCRQVAGIVAPPQLALGVQHAPCLLQPLLEGAHVEAPHGPCEAQD
mmetsp:Transcript_27204/g.78420  ORF Transcript_27204/g.78420 Transcript_27204/m.78420 type:complete len:278 (-) Transcript_27204:141-974(-)